MIEENLVGLRERKDKEKEEKLQENIKVFLRIVSYQLKIASGLGNDQELLSMGQRRRWSSQSTPTT